MRASQVPFDTYEMALKGNSNNVQVGGDNPRVEGVFYFHFDIFIFENKIAGGKMQLDG
jgi:hypothetical protein